MPRHETDSSLFGEGGGDTDPRRTVGASTAGSSARGERPDDACHTVAFLSVLFTSPRVEDMKQILRVLRRNDVKHLPQNKQIFLIMSFVNVCIREARTVVGSHVVRSE